MKRLTKSTIKKPGECSRPKRGSILSRKEGAMMLEQIMADIFSQKTLNSFLAASRPPNAKPSASKTALKLPALVAVTPSKVRRSSSRRRSSTPQVKALWLPPPCRAKLIAFWPARGVLVSMLADFGRAFITPALGAASAAFECSRRPQRDFLLRRGRGQPFYPLDDHDVLLRHEISSANKRASHLWL